MNAANEATIQALKDGNAWLIKTLKENQRRLAESNAELARILEVNKRLEARLRARAA